MFQHNGPSCWDENGYPYGIHDTFEYMFDTPFDLTSASQLADYSMSCSMEQGSWGYKSFFISNHYVSNPLVLPDVSDTRTINKFQVLEDRAIAPAKKNFLKLTNLLSINFWELGDVLKFT